MERIRTVEIIYKVSNKLPGEYIAGFLRFIGLFVTQKVEVEEEKRSCDSKENKYDIHIDLNHSFDTDDFVFDIDKNSSLKEKTCYKFLIKIIHDFISGEENGLLTEIASIYVKYQILRTSYKRHNYLENTELMQSIIPSYMEAYKELQCLASNYRKNAFYEHVEYAKLYCAEKINKLYENVIGKHCLHFDTRQLVEEMEQLHKQYPDFYNLCALQALSVNSDIQYVYDTPLYLEECIKNVEGQNSEIVSYLYYRLGLYFQRIKNDEVKAYQYYNESLKCFDENYRAAYKIAKFLAKIKFDYINAEKYFTKVLSIIEKLNQGESYDYYRPEEFLYAYKAYREIGIIRIRFEQNSEDAEKNFDMAQKIYNQLNQEITFMVQLFGEEAKELQKLTQVKMNIYQNEIDKMELSVKDGEYENEQGDKNIR